MWRDNAAAIELFVTASTQWRLAGWPPRPVGLDYPAVETAARLAGLAVTPALFADLRLMEAEALRAIAERSKP